MEPGEGSLKPGETGELVMKAPQLMQGYWNRPEETKEMLRDGWLYTGDIGYMDEDGYIFITSRKKDLIKPGGFQVWPREVEEVISAHPSVAEVSVAGIPDPKQTEAVKAWIVLREGLQATPDEIQEFCRKKLTAYKVPKYIEFRKDLPKTLVGKVLRRVLQEEEKSKQQ
jgi:long-chain acyl-CoA synthetase